MDIQKMFDVLSDASRRDRSRYHLTLGSLIDALEAAPAKAKVMFDTGAPVGSEDSYRGYYADLAFEGGARDVTVATFLKRCKAAAGSTYEGYKGGDFTMGLDTPLWYAEYGCLGPAVVGAVLKDDGLVLITKELD